MTVIALPETARRALLTDMDQFGTDDLTEIEAMLMFWKHEGTRDLALEIADRNRLRAQTERRA